MSGSGPTPRVSESENPSPVLVGLAEPRQVPASLPGLSVAVSGVLGLEPRKPPFLSETVRSR